MATDIKKLAEELVKLTVLEVNELKNTLKDEYGIEPAAAAVAVAAGPVAGAEAAAAGAAGRCPPPWLRSADALPCAAVSGLRAFRSSLCPVHSGTAAQNVLFPAEFVRAAPSDHPRACGRPGSEAAAPGGKLPGENRNNRRSC